VANYAPSSDDLKQIDSVVKRFDDCKSHHDGFIRRYERLERAYRGIVQPKSKVANWRNVITPPYAFQLIETVVANTLEEGLRFAANPSPRVQLSLEEAQHLLDQAQVVEDLIFHEHSVDEMDAKQRPLFLSDAICGRGVGASRWAYYEGQGVTQKVVHDPVYHPDTEEQIGTTPRLEMVTEQKVIADHSTFEVIDPRDFIIHESAKELQPYAPGGAQYVIHRCWYSMEQMRGYERGGYFENVDQLSDSRDMSVGVGVSDRESRLWNINRAKDLVEVLHLWEYKDGLIWTTAVGNRKVLIQKRKMSPFDHGQYPFIISSSMPGLFTTVGMSTVELVEKLQEMLWTLQSQRLDNIELINNAILLIRADIDDAEAFDWYPGAKWPVASPSDVQTFTPPYQLASLTLEAEAVLKGDLQNVTSAAPMAGGVSQSMDQTTATGVSIVMSNAQRALQARKNQAMKGLVREANMRLKNCQQFISDKRLLHILGPNGTPLFREIEPVDIQGEFKFRLTETSDSMMRQERRSEATQWLQVLSGIAPMMAATQNPLDLKELVLWAAKKWDIIDAERFFSVQPRDLGAAAQGGGQPSGPGGAVNTGGAPDPNNPNLGITSGTAVDASAPSATGGLSASPSMFAQRALALGGSGLGGSANG